jgi:hypothetical protein
MDINPTNITDMSIANIGLSLNSLLPIVGSVIILLLDNLLKSRLKRRKSDIWINFLQSDRYISLCIKQYKKIETPIFAAQLIEEFLGIICSFVIYICLTIVLPFAFSTLTIFLFAFILTLFISGHKARLKNQELLKDSERIARSILFTYWFIVTGFLEASLPYILIKSYPSIPDMRIFVLSFIFLLLSIYNLIDNRKDLLNHVKNLLNNQYSKEDTETFPKVRIIAKTEEFEGKVCDIFDDNLIVLENYGIKKAIEWDSINYMELKRYNQ